MYTILIFAVLGIGADLWYTRKDKKVSKIGSAFSGVVLGGMVGFFAAMIISMFGTHQIYRVSSETQLLSLRSSDSLSGSFLFASGKIGENVDYVYYKATADGGYRPERMNAESDNITVYEVDGLEGGTLRAIQCLNLRNYEWSKNFVLWTTSTCGLKYEFRIPKGSLVQQFSIQ